MKRATAAQGSGQMLGRGHRSLCPPAGTCSKYVSVISVGPVGRGCWEGCRQGHVAGQGRVGPGTPPTGPPRAFAPREESSRKESKKEQERESRREREGERRGGERERERGGMWPFLGPSQWAEPGGSLGRLAPVGVSLGWLHPEGQSLPIQLGSHQPTGRPPLGFRSWCRDIVLPVERPKS